MPPPAPSAEAAAGTPTLPVDPIELSVFAAASLTEPFEAIATMFEAENPGVSVVFNFAGSQQLAQQINDGAPADVFASANDRQMAAAVEAGSVIRAASRTFAQNRLVVIVPPDNPGGLAALQDLARPGLLLVLAAPEVPVGQYTLDFLDKATADPAFGAGYKADVLQNVASYEDNARAVLAKVALGEADAGVVYASDVAGESAGRVVRLEIPDALNGIGSYPIAPAAEARHPAVAQAFVNFVLSPEGQAVLVQYNFIPATK
jgi:molybdate transport system substrate-binding protein